MWRSRFLLCTLFLMLFPANALERQDVIFKIFQFPPDKIPRIDGDDR
jgi:hypothetical protein